MSRTVFCKKLHQEAPGLERAPFPSELGERIFNHISQTAWQSWLNHQTMLINEYRLSVVDPKAKAFLFAEMEKFLFGEGIPFGFQGAGKALAGEGEGVYTEYMTKPESREQHSQNLKGEGYSAAPSGYLPTE